MDEQNFFDQKPTKATGMLNVLTILTFIGSGVGILLSVATPFISKFFMGFMEKGMEGATLSDSQLADIEKAKAAFALMEKKYDAFNNNRCCSMCTLYSWCHYDEKT